MVQGFVLNMRVNRGNGSMAKVCQACNVTYESTKQTKCSYCESTLKIVSSQGMCPNVSLQILQANMAEHTNLYFGTH